MGNLLAHSCRVSAGWTLDGVGYASSLDGDFDARAFTLLAVFQISSAVGLFMGAVLVPFVFLSMRHLRFFIRIGVHRCSSVVHFIRPAATFSRSDAEKGINAADGSRLEKDPFRDERGNPPERRFLSKKMKNSSLMEQVHRASHAPARGVEFGHANAGRRHVPRRRACAD